MALRISARQHRYGEGILGLRAARILRALAAAGQRIVRRSCGTALLDTVGGYAEQLARAGGLLPVLVGLLVIAVKVVGGLVALGLARPGGGSKRRRLLILALAVTTWRSSRQARVLV
jgi:hypothetical protein